MSEKVPRMTIADVLNDPPDFEIAIEDCEVIDPEEKIAKSSGKPFEKMRLNDGTGEIEALYFGSWISRGARIHVKGRVKIDTFKGKKQATFLVDDTAKSNYSPENSPPLTQDGAVTPESYAERYSESLKEGKARLSKCFTPGEDTITAEANKFAMSALITGKQCGWNFARPFFSTPKQEEPEQPEDLPM